MDVNVTALTTGWAAFGLNTGPVMVNGDVVVAYVDAGGHAVVRAHRAPLAVLWHPLTGVKRLGRNVTADLRWLCDTVRPSEPGHGPWRHQRHLAHHWYGGCDASSRFITRLTRWPVACARAVSQSGTTLSFSFRRPLQTNDTFDKSFQKVTRRRHRALAHGSARSCPTCVLVDITRRTTWCTSCTQSAAGPVQRCCSTA